LGALVAYTESAADAVESQDGSVPDLVSTGAPTGATGSSADSEPPSAPSDTPAAVGSEEGSPFARQDARNGARTTGNRTKGPAAATRADITKRARAVLTLSYVSDVLGRWLPWVIAIGVA